MDRSSADSFVYSLLNAPSPVVMGSYSRHSRKNTSFIQKPQDSLMTPTAFNSKRSRTDKSASKADTLLGLTSIDFSGNSLLVDPFVDVTALSTTANAVHEDNPAKSITRELYGKFMEVFQSFKGEHEVFDLLDSYETICNEYLVKLEKALCASHSSKTSECGLLAGMLHHEKYTWQLTKILFKDRLQVEENGECDPMMVDSVGERMSDKEIVDQLYARDSLVRLSQLVIDWLETIAADTFQRNYNERVEYFSDGGLAWENTLHSLQTRLPGSLGLSRKLVTELDPDAPLRQKLPLHDLDKDDELRLLKHMFGYIRAGQLGKAQELAVQHGHHWLAVALEGWRLHHDPNYKEYGKDNGVLNPIEGNPYRDLWKNACWRAVQNVNIPHYERAIYSLLCGNLSQLLSICTSWEDHLWAHLRVLVDVSTEQELRTSTQQSRALEPLPSFYPSKRPHLEEVFREIEASSDKKIKEESKAFYRVLQKYIILDDVNSLIEEMYECVTRNQECNHHLVRFMAHLILFLRIIGQCAKEELCNNILEAYVRVLIEDKNVPLVATYTSLLPEHSQVSCYTDFLMGITDNEEREQCLELAKKVDLDVPRITKMLVEKIRFHEPVEMALDLKEVPETSEEDLRKIDALTWLLFDPSMRSEALKQANALMRIFVSCNKLEAARQTFSKIPGDSIDVVIKQWFRQTGSNELMADDDNTTREFICFQAYFQAHDAFEFWFEHFHHAKPEEPVPPESGKHKFTEYVAYEHRLKQYEQDLNHWKRSLEAHTKSAKEKIYNVLLFLNGGWMVDQRVDNEIDDSRQEQMSALRKLCIPQMTFLLHTVLHKTEEYKECLNLANIISSEKDKLYLEFNKQEMHTLLLKFRESSLNLLEKKCDPLGYPVE